MYLSPPTNPSGQPQGKIQQLLNNPRTRSRGGENLEHGGTASSSQSVACGSQTSGLSLTENLLQMQMYGPHLMNQELDGDRGQQYVLTSPPGDSEAGQLLRKTEKNYPQVNPGAV